MPLRREQAHVNPNPHFDGDKEGIYNDPTASAGSTVGIQLNAKNDFAQERNPFNYAPKLDPEMEEFEKLMRGKKVDVNEQQ